MQALRKIRIAVFSHSVLSHTLGCFTERLYSLGESLCQRSTASERRPFLHSEKQNEVCMHTQKTSNTLLLWDKRHHCCQTEIGRCIRIQMRQYYHVHRPAKERHPAHVTSVLWLIPLNAQTLKAGHITNLQGTNSESPHLEIRKNNCLLLVNIISCPGVGAERNLEGKNLSSFNWERWERERNVTDLLIPCIAWHSFQEWIIKISPSKGFVSIFVAWFLSCKVS